ncbi:MAG: hypothetical protein ACKO8J_05310, partial [Candidatus Limnocylindrus sp.]
MSNDERTPKSSAFAAALFSILLPGLGQAYQRRWHAALRFAAPLFLLVAGFSGIYVADGLAGLLGLLLSPLGLSAAGILNILAALWRAAAATEAWRQGLTRASGVRATLLS